MAHPFVMPGIHVFAAYQKKDVDGRDKPGHDKSCHTREGGYPVRGSFDHSQTPRNTGSPAFAGDDVRITEVRPHTSGFTSGSASTSSRKRSPRISKLRN